MGNSLSLYVQIIPQIHAEATLVEEREKVLLQQYEHARRHNI